jgi:sulfur-oxidizing protein SoxY
MKRRELVKAGSGAAVLKLALAGGLLPGQVLAQGAWNKEAFDAHTLAECAKALGGSMPTESKDVVLQAPEVAENGNEVRMALSSTIPGVTQIALLIEKNPNILAAVFEVPPGTDANFSTNVRMLRSSKVYALARVGDKYVYAVKDVKVTLGGCG